MTSMIAEDYFILANDEHHFFMFDRVGYKLLDKGFVRHYKVNCMLQLKDNMVVFGHQHGVITLWDTSKRFLTNEELSLL